jgi:hypothetical protein
MLVPRMATLSTDEKIRIRVVNLKPSCRKFTSKLNNTALKYIIIWDTICVFPLVMDVIE